MLSRPIPQVPEHAASGGGRASTLIGRERELGVLREVWQHAHACRPALAVVAGDPGIGKSTLMAELIAEAGVGAAVLRLDGAQWEAGLPFGALETSGLLPGVNPAATPVEISLRLQRTIRSRRGATLMVVDDAQWLDVQTLQVLAALLRRGVSLPLAMIVAVRTGGEVDELLRAAARHRTERVPVGGLSAADLRALVGARGHRLSVWAAGRLHRHTLGNPQDALQITDAFGAGPLHTGSGLIPVPPGLDAPVRARLAAVSADARAVASALSVWDGPATVPVLSELTAAGVDVAAGLDDARTHGLLTVRHSARGPEAEIRHPAVASVLVHDLSPAEHTALHARSAHLAGDAARAMRHRLAAATGRDDDLARAAVGLAESCADAGHRIVAVELLLAAADFFDSADDRAETCYRAVDHLARAGEVEWARAVLADLGAPGAHASSLCLLAHGQVALLQGDLVSARRTLERAWVSSPAAAQRVRASGLLALIAVTRGDAGQLDTWTARAADELDDLTGTAREGDARLEVGVAQLWLGDLRGAIGTLGEVAGALGRDSLLTTAFAQCYLIEALYRRGEWDRAAAVADTALNPSGDTDALHAISMVRIMTASVLSGRGDRDTADHLLARAERSLRHTDDLPALLWLRIGQARHAAMRGDHDAVVTALLPLTADGAGSGLPEGVTPWRTELIESLAALGRVDEADAAYRDFAASTTLGGAFVRCEAARAAGQLAVARGDLAAAEAAFGDGVADEPEAGAFTRARLHLAAGAWLRRRGTRRAARDRLAAAEVLFTGLGATPWLENTRHELGLCGGVPAAMGPVLTPAERAVAALVAEGASNRDAAQRLSVSVKTVEAHLSRIYAKLGVRGRTQLAARWGDAHPEREPIV